MTEYSEIILLYFRRLLCCNEERDGGAVLVQRCKKEQEGQVDTEAPPTLPRRRAAWWGEECSGMGTSAGRCDLPDSSGTALEMPALGEMLAVMVAEERETLTPESFITMIPEGCDQRWIRVM